jgi:hypothetical protein
MKHLQFNKRLAILLITPLLISLACNASTGGTPADSQPKNMTIQRDIVYGSGPFNLPDAKVGLSDLSSYKATLTLSFDGTRDGKAEKWSETYLMLMQKDPAARQLTIEKSGDLTDLDPVFRAEANETAYQRIGENSCSATQIETGNSLGDRMEPASFLNYVIGADEAGNETVNDISANHYKFDQHALGQGDLTESTGEMWVASEGGYVVKYVLTTKGKADYFGAGIEGTLSFDYELTDVNQPVEIKLPEDCPPGLVDAPKLPDASNVVSSLGLLTYETSSSVQDAGAFYQKELPNLGWKVVGKPSITDTSALLAFTKEDQTMSIIITAENGITTVQILLSRSQK